ncbi:MAG TPA: hypothetical protein VN203_17830, partial [Candidatus Acidoferrum sp.]|nr:hypothetical protein [Candidatus Acidoferrum sp.]
HRPCQRSRGSDEKGLTGGKEVQVRWGFRLFAVVAVATMLLEGISRAGQPGSGLATRAPEIQSSVWINGGPASAADLRGRVVLVEFWTYG